MRTRVVLLPDALEKLGEAPLFERLPAALEEILSRGGLLRVREAKSNCREAGWLGLEPNTFQLSEGVLAVAAFDADPPDRSVHFCASILSIMGDEIRTADYPPSNENIEELLGQVKRLETSKLKLIVGREMEHALVWEDGSTDLSCKEPSVAIEQGLRRALPEGDGETMLRRFLDDSVNLLSELEVNKVRVDEGLNPINLIWPWGPGLRPRMPNLTVERGTSVRVESPSIRLKGLSKLVGYRHGDPWSLGKGTNLRLKELAALVAASPFAIVVLPTIGELRSKEMEEEARWLGREVGLRLLAPLFGEPRNQPARVILIATQKCGEGLALDYRSDCPIERREMRFGAELLEDRKTGSTTLHELIEEALISR